MNVAHHGSYAAWLEAARTELLRAGGITYAQMEQAGVFLVITRMAISYKAPARYDDLLVVATRVSGGGRARIDHAYEIWRDAEDGRGRSALLAIAETTLACVDTHGRPCALPDWLRASSHGPIGPKSA
jgi:acyl-CoA thioester hydrolase